MPCKREDKTGVGTLAFNGESRIVDRVGSRDYGSAEGRSRGLRVLKRVIEA